ncbi:MAG: methyltransferase [Acholeplasma sp.]|nr:methyltransferase [Acholeplasma sp.]
MSFLVETKRFRLQQTKEQAFNTDTILLSDFISVPKGCKNILDIGTGSGVLMFDLANKTSANIQGIEIQKNRYLQALGNIELNDYKERVNVVLGDVRDYKFDVLFDLIISNPPFFKVVDDKRLSHKTEDKLSRHEVSLSLEALLKSASKNLKYRGYFYMVHRPDRLNEIILLCGKYNLAIKKIRFVHPYVNSDANHVLIMAIKNGGEGIKVLNPLVLYEEKHVLTAEIKKIIGDF